MILIDVTGETDMRTKQRLELAEAVIADQAARIQMLEQLLRQASKELKKIEEITRA